MPRTRLAPSPTGALHLGNVRTFLVNWAVARQQGWQIVLRVEDLDGPRIKADAAGEAIELLAWLGLDWDEGPYTQLADLAPYHAALDRLIAAGQAYPCRCTRREIEAAQLSAPHGDDHELRYPGTCRPSSVGPEPGGWGRSAAEPPGCAAAPGGSLPSSPATQQPDDRAAAYRLIVPAGETTIEDNFAGAHCYDVSAATGDFLIATKEGLPSYQLAVVVDDARQGIDRVVRGDDLLSSAHRQRLLYDRLGLGPPPQSWHLPLVVGPDGRRLAKRHGDTRASYYRQRGVRPERIIGLMAAWCGLGPREEMTAAAFRERFAWEHLPRAPIVFSKDDDAWLLNS